MIKRYRNLLIITSIVILLPAVVGVVLWNDLPDTMATHWGTDNEANGWSPKWFAVFGIPAIMLALHWVCTIATAADHANRATNGKLTRLVLWIIPVFSLFAAGSVYPAALGREVDVRFLSQAVIGVMFIIIGNYLPKCRQNRTLGIKVKWTLESEENWNATHRLAGKLWVLCGAVMFVCAFLPSAAAVTLVTLPLMVAVPVIYSYRYHKKTEAQK